MKLSRLQTDVISSIENQLFWFKRNAIEDDAIHFIVEESLSNVEDLKQGEIEVIKNILFNLFSAIKKL